MARQFVLAGLLLLMVFGDARADGLLERAIASYSQGLDLQDRDQRLRTFAEAEQLFRQAVQQHPDNPDLLVNLGNAALQAEHVGSAIVAYRRALRLDPKHPLATQNLFHARSVLPAWVQRKESSNLLNTLFFWQQIVSPRTLATIVALVFLAATLLFAVGLVRQSALARNVSWFLLAVWIVLLATQMMNRKSADPQGAVVIRPSVVLHSADSENSPPRLDERLPDGTELRVLQSRDLWLEVEVTGKSGWILASNVETVVK